MPSLPAQALPPDKRPKEPPAPFEDTLPSGLFVKWRMPDPFTIIAFDGHIPDPVTAAVIDLLKNEKSYVEDDAPFRHRYEAANVKGMYALAGAMLESPKLDVRLEYGDGETLGRREVGFQDVIQLYFWFRSRTRTAVIPSPRADIIERTTDAPSDRGDVPPDTSAAVGD